MEATLNHLKPGQSGKVININAKGIIKKKLMDMGVSHGVEFKVNKVAPLGEPIEIHIRGYALRLRIDEDDS